MDKNNKPQIRFKGYTDAWEQRKLLDITYPSGEKNRENLPYESYSITNENGFVPQNEKFVNGGTMRDADKRMYYIVSPQSFAYNPARINVGSIGYQNTSKNVIVSSLYEVFKTTENVDDRFLWHWFKSDDFQKLIVQLQEGGVRLYFYYDKLCIGTISLPTLDEQHHIGALLDNLDHLITLHQRKLKMLKNVKNSCLEKMFPKNNTSTPEVRFANFTDAWEQRKFENLYNYASEGGTPDTNNPAFYEDGSIPFVKIEDTLEKYITSPKSFITEEGVNHSSAWLIPTDSVIFTNGATVGNVAINKLPVTTKQGILGIIPSPKVTSELLYYLLTSSNFQREVQSRMATGTFATIILKNLNDIPVWYPSNSKEQYAIITVLSKLDHLITLHQRKLEKLQNIKKSCLEKMFV